MKQSPFLKSSRSLLIGVGMAGALLPLTAVHAADQDSPAQLELSQSVWSDPALRNDTSTGGSSMRDQSTSGTSQSQGTSQSPDVNQTINNEPSGAGVQGPIRSDDMSNEPAATDSSSSTSERRNRPSSSSSGSRDVDTNLAPLDGGHPDRQSNIPSYPPQ